MELDDVHCLCSCQGGDLEGAEEQQACCSEEQLSMLSCEENAEHSEEASEPGFFWISNHSDSELSEANTEEICYQRCHLSLGTSEQASPSETHKPCNGHFFPAHHALKNIDMLYAFRRDDGLSNAGRTPFH